MITSIKREFNLFPNIVGIVATDDLTVITTADYFSSQAADVELLNNGVWQWENEDIVLIYYATAQIGWFTYDATTDAFVSVAANGGLSNTLPSGDIFVGNASNVATAAAMSGVVAITNTGVTSIPLASAEILVGNSSGVAAPVAMSGGATISDTGVVTVSQVGQLFSTSVTLDTAEVVAAYATPQVLIPAVAGMVAIVHSVNVYTASTGNTAFATGTAPIIQYGTTVHGAGNIATGTGLVTGDITAASSQVRTIDQAASAVYTGITDTAVTFSCATAYTAGTGTSVTFTLVYELIAATI
jgi:hypothetical protein